MHGCTCICMHMHAYAWTCMYTYAWICVHIHAYACISCISMHGYTCICTHMHAYAYMCRYMHAYACISVHGYVCICMHMHHIHAWVYTYDSIFVIFGPWGRLFRYRDVCQSPSHCKFKTSHQFNQQNNVLLHFFKGQNAFVRLLCQSGGQL